MENLKINNIDAMIENNHILKDLAFNFEKNKIYAILGPNGSGKTSLFKAVLGQIKYTGNISIDGISLNNKKNQNDSLKRIGTVMPFPDEYNNTKVYELFKEHLFYYTYQNQDVISLLNKINLKITSETKMSQLSLGMKQKLNIAMAISHNPDILLLDEPFNGLDVNGIEVLKEIVKDFVKNDKIVLISSHTIYELENLIDEFIILNNGHLICTNNMKTILNKNFKSLDIYYKEVIGGQDERNF